jgi:hypothetical protein
MDADREDSMRYLRYIVSPPGARSSEQTVYDEAAPDIAAVRYATQHQTPVGACLEVHLADGGSGRPHGQTWWYEVVLTAPSPGGPGAGGYQRVGVLPLDRVGAVQRGCVNPDG